MCLHFQKHLVWTDVGNEGHPLRARQLRYQCPDCGKLFGVSVAHAQASPDTPYVDREKLHAWREQEDARWKAAQLHYRQQRESESAEWWARYNAYLESDAWWRLRPLVLDRAGGMCEGCGRARATQVHHLTYEHATNEFLWELVAICDACHDRVHEWKT
jgi:5-methylcytosine-specific restriction endonuclease McrA